MKVFSVYLPFYSMLIIHTAQMSATHCTGHVSLLRDFHNDHRENGGFTSKLGVCGGTGEIQAGLIYGTCKLSHH